MHKSDKFEKRNEILFVLMAAKQIMNVSLTRIEMQKIIYLINILAPLKSLILDYFEFKVWHNGPYSKDIQNTLNNLVALNLVEMPDYKIKNNNNKISEMSKYTISPLGENIVSQLILYDAKQEEYQWILSIVRLVNLYGINNIVEIVYQEPTFKYLKNKNDGFGSTIYINEIDDNKLISLIKEIKKIGEQDFGYRFDKPEDILLAVFDYLYSEIH